ncbi:2-oxo-4-hydroxy-4-carboxy-5-ureidoimidazoline decarboxylase [Gulosibacter sp. 10]|uniref:2-oxo-4-hydroxy-4-carboxy-5-ureidoimidazoline decarboxylase n=1 Tax=Gulosibacter sp. 10 TaxID=1255570 RepID=UPI00097F6AA2|nr:2-oxo-4-hydroxy-4-carboxy-5-ureidoimidazoline decarboxylase [Gulosibacter sp. 10]SJM69544.1 Uricase [Gulosibacter sp. 10]
MSLTVFNRLDADAAADMIRPCADIPRWIETVVSSRPYSNVEEALSVAKNATAEWSAQEVDGALSGHPRIGERADGEDKEAELSRAEQAGVEAEDAQVLADLARGNREYEERFGHIFLIRAAGRSAREMLDELHRRLSNSPEDELDESAGQLREIALLRLEGILNA